MLCVMIVTVTIADAMTTARRHTDLEKNPGPMEVHEHVSTDKVPTPNAEVDADIAAGRVTFYPDSESFIEALESRIADQ